ncbi:MAG: aminopeptidase [Saprospiraceae bacterium]|nr:aminopeptidase [Saprospiraceae bacterium]
MNTSTSLLNKYAYLLVNYCLSLKAGERLFVKSTTLAEPLVREVWREATKVGAKVEVSLDFREQNRILMLEGNEDQLTTISPLYKMAMEEFEAYLYIRAPFNSREDADVPSQKAKIRSEAFAEINKIYFQRTATRDLKRNLCQYPTLAAAQDAGMSLERYEEFVFNACHLFDESPTESWLKVRNEQKRLVDYLNNTTNVQYKGKDIDISFSTKGRTWINSDGQTNMPSGEIYTSPVEDSVNGVIRFSYPSMYAGNELQDVTLWVKDGFIEKWEAKTGKNILDNVFAIAGTRRFGEAAIGTNYNINRITKNILFDEKIGGSIHMAIGQSYLQAGGKNESTVHWDMISDMQDGGEIIADGELIYKNGRFLI